MTAPFHSKKRRWPVLLAFACGFSLLAPQPTAAEDGASAQLRMLTRGDLAPEFALAPLRFYDFKVDERPITRKNAGVLYAPVRLSEFRGKRPVALLFTSYTASPSRQRLEALEHLYDTYKDRLQFLLVYIKETDEAERHADTIPDRRRFAEPRTSLDRLRVANTWVSQMNLTIPCVVDAIDDSAMKAFGAHPARIFLVGKDGHITFTSHDLDPALLEKAIRAEIDASGGRGKGPGEAIRFKTTRHAGVERCACRLA